MFCALLTAGACAEAHRAEHEPRAALADNTQAQREFRSLSSAWHSLAATERVHLEQPLREYIARYPKEDPTRLARGYLGWILYQKGELVEAERCIDPNLRGPEGRAKDFSQVVEGAVLTEHGRPLDAIRLLRPLQRQLIDPIERFLATEQLVHGALAAALYAEALNYMVDWLDQAEARDRTRIAEAIEARVAKIPDSYLEHALDPLEQEGESSTNSDAHRGIHRQWLFQTITKQLAHVAERTRNVSLAARILERNPALALDPASSSLVQLATGGEPPATIAGRTIGLLLETNDALSRRRAADVAAGIAFVLDQKEGRDHDVQLVFEDAVPDAAAGLSKLLAQGAAVLVAGIDTKNSDAAMHYAQVSQAPLLSLASNPTGSDFAFSVGLAAAAEEGLLSTLLVNMGYRVMTYGPLDYPCNDPALTLPWQTPDAVRITGAALLLDGTCLKAFTHDTHGSSPKPRLALGVESSFTALTKPDTLRGYSQPLFLSAGYYPFMDEQPSDLEAFRARSRRIPNWYETLGHDVAEIAVQVMAPLPEVRSTELADVTRYHASVQQALRGFESDKLWSSKHARFDAQHQLERELGLAGQDPKNDSDKQGSP
ncbi:MAG TPA: hypothetical protein VHM70_31890 [Polyangiaceae bacterium]|jgi:hypothetical protein|nr:hypothetical protein [Polyangiaceae bacterium]